MHILIRESVSQFFFYFFQDKPQSRLTEVFLPISIDLSKRSRVKGARGLRYIRQLETLEAARLKREKRRQQVVLIV